MTLLLFASNFELSKNLSVFVPLWLNDYKEKKTIRKNTYG
jgi:Na+-transporting NADH:ubiquinone oxidoreductase subunit NqrD